MYIHLTHKSGNSKVGKIPVSTTSAKSCPITCPFNHANKGGCYADYGPLKFHWLKVTDRKRGTPQDLFFEQIKKLPKGQFWRHNQAGDLVGDGTYIDLLALIDLVEANKGKKGFTYTHYNPWLLANCNAINYANQNGFTINLSGNNLKHAEELYMLDIGPVVTVLPINQLINTETENGIKVVICPAITKDNVTCDTCRLCQTVDRKAIIGFPAHGVGKRKVSETATL